MVKKVCLEILTNVLSLSRVGGLCLTYKTGSGFEDWIYCTLYIHNSGLQVIQR
jgi:hypothetical protein